MKLAQLRSLVAIAKAGSIQEAANLIGVSQPGLSKSVQALEQEVGATLLERGARGVSLTEYGQVVVKRSIAIQREVDRLQEEIGWLKAECGGRLTIGMTALAAGTIVAAAVLRLRKRYPAIEVRLIELRPGQILEGLRDGSLDLGIPTLHGATSLAGFETRLVRRYPTRLVGGGPRSEAPIPIELILHEEWIETELADRPQSYIQALAASFGVSPPARILQCTSLHLAVELAAELGAICCMSASSVPFFEGKIRAGRLTPLNVMGDLPDMNCVLVYNSEDLLTPAAREFSKILRLLGKESDPAG